MTQFIPPRSDELEVSVMGPGRGECVVVHLGNNDWCIVDSCVAPGAKDPVAIEYLRGFGTEALAGIRMVLATHWHDDHIRGLASIYRLAPNARFCCSMALNNDNFAQLVEIGGAMIQERSGVKEFKKIFDLLRLRSAEVPAHLVAPKFAIENTRLLHLSEPDRCCTASVTALSPSGGTVRHALSEFARWLPSTGDFQRSIPDISPNKMSVVLWIEAGHRRVLLGADLEHTTNSGDGWLAVLACHQDAVPADIFKIPHHGSINADCPNVWSRMLGTNPIAVVTPYRARVQLPRESDLTRLASRTARLYCTAAGAGKAPTRGTLVEKMMRRTLKQRRVIEGQPGHVRVRWPIRPENASPAIEVFGPAFQYEHGQ